MTKQVILTTEAPAPIGPYSQAVWADNLLFISGQIPLHPHTGELVADGIAAETRRVMDNLAAILTAANLSFAHVVKTSIFLSNMDDFSAVNSVYGEYFAGIIPPARETVQVARLPRNVNVEISAVATRTLNS